MTTSTIVTGGSSGIGAEISSQAVADGHDVLMPPPIEPVSC
ncbi:MAG TPA: hypothetical protein VMS74_03090 [Acidimicrobiia bacterium]|nr:hypothetical protein [Acidimicrobiia bacterium]